MKAERKRGLGAERGDQGAARQLSRENRERRARKAEHGDPQEHRALVVPPRAGDLVDEGLCAVTVLGNQRDRQIGAREDHKQHREGDQAKQPLHDRERSDRLVGFDPPTNVKHAQEQPE